MSGGRYRVKEVSRLAGVTVRALHHYDAIGLLVPSARTPAGYRQYDGGDLLRLQQIVIGRELGLSLEEIRRLLDEPGFDRREALRAQRRRLERRLETTRAMIGSIDAALAALEDDAMTRPETLFDGFDPERYADEARARWGHTDAWRESARRTARYTPDVWATIHAENDALLREVAAARSAGTAPDSRQACELAERHRLHIDRWYYPCSRPMHASLAELYVGDERFTAGFDRHGAGTAAWLSDAIRANAGRG